MKLSISENDYISHPLIKDQLIKRRSYQESIFINCLNNNCLVVIPTGLGKTIIALMLAVHRLHQLPKSKVIFLAPTKPLVNQHYNNFKELINLPPETLASITGSINPTKRREIWNGLKIAFMTPQVLQNDIITNLYSIKNVSLIIFDECHRAIGDYAYCFIAEKYKNQSKNPQILGLTASPGSTEEKINEIKKNLFVNHIEIRTDSDSDVKPYIQNVDNKWIRIKLPPEFLEIKNIFDDKLKTAYKILKGGGIIESYDINKISRKDLLRVNQNIDSKINLTVDNQEKFNLFYIKKVLANAIRISHMSELIETQGINALSDYLEKNTEKIKKHNANKSLIELFSDSDIIQVLKITKSIQDQGIIHPKLEYLKDLLIRQIEENSDSRVLVFCHYRDSVNNIVKYLKKFNKIKVHKFVGQQTKGSDKGLTQKKQIELLKDFKDGFYNTLVGTSVAEEGLDIAECDMVVFYDVVPSAIRSIQRRGRTGRKKEGKVYVLIAEDTRDEGYYWAEKAKESTMRSSLKSIKGMENVTDPGNKQKSILSFTNKNSLKSDNNNGIKVIDEFKVSVEKVTIICDNRETASPVVRTLSLFDAQIELKQLDIADYIVSERTGLERKSTEDFTSSIKDGRLFKELCNLSKNFAISILILEGNVFSNLSINENAIYGAITSIILNLGVQIYRTESPEETAKFIFQLAKKEQQENKSKPKVRFGKTPQNFPNLLEYITSGFPGVNTYRAKSLLRELQTVQNITNAEIGDLMKVENIGKKTAQNIYKISRFKYKEKKE